MKKNLMDLEFEDLDVASFEASRLSTVTGTSRFVIQAGDKYFVSRVNNTQHYETLHCHYHNGKLQELKSARRA